MVNYENDGTQNKHLSDDGHKGLLYSAEKQCPEYAKENFRKKSYQQIHAERMKKNGC